jgi:hypothetical protein
MSAYTQTTIPMTRMYPGYQDFITMFANGHFCKNLLLAKYRLRADAAIIPGRPIHRVPNKAEAIAMRDRISMGI